jgi:hypothetical protein
LGQTQSSCAMCRPIPLLWEFQLVSFLAGKR